MAAGEVKLEKVVYLGPMAEVTLDGGIVCPREIAVEVPAELAERIIDTDENPMFVREGGARKRKRSAAEKGE